FVQWAKLNGMAIRYIQPGKPNQNAYIERFNRTFREEVLDQHLFTRLDDVREAAYWWMLEYNEELPHDSLGDLTPAEYRQRVAGSATFERPAGRGSLRRLVGSGRARAGGRRRRAVERERYTARPRPPLRAVHVQPDPAGPARGRTGA